MHARTRQATVEHQAESYTLLVAGAIAVARLRKSRMLKHAVGRPLDP